MRENLTIGFIGNPNCGKTTLFNAYTGANLKVANWPGVTVEKVEGAIKDHDLNIRLVDLPGTYSLTSYTMEEQVSRQFILSDEVDVIIDVADASALERNLYLTLQLLELGKPVVLALNMMDIVEKRGMEIDTHRLPEMLGINHCREGREGCRLPSGSCLYLGEGDLSIHTMDNCASEMSFPLKHYRGISVVLNLEAVAKNPPGTLAESGIDILQFKEKFCMDGACFIMRAKDEIEHIFSELYSVPDCLQKPYFQIKVQELLLFLYLVDVKKEKQREIYTSPQVEVVKEIHKMLISDLQKRPTIEELSKKYLINTATLKDTFKGIYGQPIGTYMKEYRMKQAAVLLRQTQATIAEIANQVGYENQSKFATAFRDVLKIAPAEYRKQNSGD